MAGLALDVIIASALLSAPPELPADPSGAVPAVDEAEPAPDDVAEPTPEPVPEPTPEPTPVPEAEPTIVATSGPRSVDPERAPLHRRDDDDDDDDEIEGFAKGLWAMRFIFGGLAPLNVGGLSNNNVNRLTFTEMGFRRVVGEQVAIDFSVGAGVFHHNPDEGDSQNDVGLATSYGIQRWFKVRKRIAPFVGGRLRLNYAEPDGRANWQVGVGFGPMMGIEYFVGNRLSLTMQGEAQLGFNVFRGLLQVQAATMITAGGQTGLAFYF